VHKRRHRAEQILGRVEGAAHGLRFADVALRRETRAVEHRDRFVERLSATAYDGDLRAAPAELQRNCPTDPGAAARDERDAARQVTVRHRPGGPVELRRSARETSPWRPPESATDRSCR